MCVCVGVWKVEGPPQDADFGGGVGGAMSRWLAGDAAGSGRDLRRQRLLERCRCPWVTEGLCHELPTVRPLLWGPFRGALPVRDTPLSHHKSSGSQLSR